jgi:hypothetical protein
MMPTPGVHGLAAGRALWLLAGCGGALALARVAANACILAFGHSLTPGTGAAARRAGWHRSTR